MRPFYGAPRKRGLGGVGRCIWVLNVHRASFIVGALPARLAGRGVGPDAFSPLFLIRQGRIT